MPERKADLSAIKTCAKHSNDRALSWGSRRQQKWYYDTIFVVCEL
ncbi:hypothetical protein [Campylobacter gastrosuis]|uniref:Uncharacterized protein n=1 Tax=Campylobacter gastrosuis TaxID=2974576 RepID=A0ABT7HTQ7_9BACT|nr:hypothetical protein [Campylobacter gastrosuis]MDL0089826.1 hypothetical protein [Campylobacter gastrosuis]MDL0089828.1 hypothetical protein [Campylobacter gastrosuis]